jgi:organic hydroperoxide reductase OsmC/OhrA
MGGASALTLSAAQAFRGDPTHANPEDLLVAALSSCHMLTFLAVCARKGIVVDRYEDDATGLLERASGAPMQVTRVTLRPRITFAGTPPDATTMASLHEQAHHGCFIANSVKTIVTVEPA